MAFYTDMPQVKDWVLQFVTTLKPIATGLYSTDLGPSDAQFAQFAFGEHLTRILELKRKYNPNDSLTTFGLSALNAPTSTKSAL